METLTYSAGDYIFRQNDESKSAFIIESGHVEFIKETAATKTKLTIAGAGEIFGEMGLIDEKPRSASARAMADVTLTKISSEEFVEILFTNPDKGIKFLSAFFERLRQLTARLNDDDLSQPTAYLINNTYKEDKVTFIPSGGTSYVDIPTEGIVLKRFPFRIGRRLPIPGKYSFDMNDLLIDDREPFNVSRNHISIEREAGKYKVVDRGSFKGTLVNGKRIGREREESVCFIGRGKHKIRLGGKDSPFEFHLVIET